MGQIETIIANLGAISVATLTQTPTIFTLSNAVDSIMRPPARVILPMLNTEEGKGIL